MKFKLIVTTAALALTFGAATVAQAASYVYVGSWYVGSGPVWSDNPAVYTGQEAAALLFGGAASNYAISTIDTNPLNINFSTFVDRYGDTTNLYTPVAQNYSLVTGTGYGSPPSASAYVLDHSCSERYGNPGLACAPGTPGLNFAFRLSGGVPEPQSWVLLIAGFGLTGAAMRRRKAVAA